MTARLFRRAARMGAALLVAGIGNSPAGAAIVPVDDVMK